MKRFPPPFRVPSAQLYLSTSWILSGNLLHLYYMQTGGKVKCFSAQKEGDMLEVLGRIGLGVCLCGYAAIVLWVWGWDKRKDRRERRHGESSDKTGAVQQGNVSGAEGGASAVMCEEMALAEIKGGHM